MYVGDHPSNNISHPDPGPRTELAGDVVPLDFSGSGGNWQRTGPSAPDSRAQALKILNAPGTGNVVGFGNQKILK
jgi:hypothetical protein